MKKINPTHQTIIRLRQEGLSYGAIAETMQMPRNTVIAICRRAGIKAEDLKEILAKDAVNIKLCKNCGAPFVNPWNRKGKVFCSPTCHATWWNHKRNEEYKAMKETLKEAIKEASAEEAKPPNNESGLPNNKPGTQNNQDDHQNEPTSQNNESGSQNHTKNPLTLSPS